MSQINNIIKYVLSGFLLVLPLVFNVPAYADISVQGVSGTWSNVTGGSNVQGVGTKQIWWGGNTVKKQKSSYKFKAPNPVIFPVAIGENFNLGKFVHLNRVIPTGSGITDATLKVLISLNINGTLLSNLPFTFDFHHNETPNVAGQCPAGSASVCDDIVTFTNNHSQSSIFTIGDQQYTIDISGFLINGQLAQQFLTRENRKNVAKLQGVITAVSVPEPSTYLILGSALGVALFALNKRKKYRVQKN